MGVSAAPPEVLDQASQLQPWRVGLRRGSRPGGRFYRRIDAM